MAGSRWDDLEDDSAPAHDEDADHADADADADDADVRAGDRTRASDRGRWTRRPDLADVLAGLALAGTAWWYYALSRTHLFSFDDWAVAARPNGIADYFRPHNQHLSALSLATYRGLYGLFGMRTYVPFRLLGVTTLLALVAGVYELARRRVGAAAGLVAGAVVLWAPAMPRSPFLFNFYVPLLLGVACAALLPRRSRQADVAIAAALGVSLLTSSLGVVLVVACAAHAVLDGYRLRRWLAVGVPGALWALWYVRQGEPTEDAPGVAETVETTLRGVGRTFQAVALRSTLLAAVVAAGTLALLLWRWRADRTSFRTQLAWLAGLGVWFLGVSRDRADEVASATESSRYQFVGVVLLVLALVPAAPLATTTRTRLRQVSVVGVGAVLALLVLVADAGTIRSAAGPRTRTADEVRRISVEVERFELGLEPSQRLPVGLAGLRLDAYERALERYGPAFEAADAGPGDVLTDRDALDAFLIDHGGLVSTRLRTGPDGVDDTACLEQPVELGIGRRVFVRAGAGAVTVAARRFGEEDTVVATVNAGSLVRVQAAASLLDEPWFVSAGDACLLADPERIGEGARG